MIPLCDKKVLFLMDSWQKAEEYAEFKYFVVQRFFREPSGTSKRFIKEGGIKESANYGFYHEKTGGKVAI